MNSKVAKLARRAGVVGAGGAGFPTHVKLNTHVDYIILNGAECEAFNYGGSGPYIEGFCPPCSYAGGNA